MCCVITSSTARKNQLRFTRVLPHHAFVLTTRIGAEGFETLDEMASQRGVSTVAMCCAILLRIPTGSKCWRLTTSGGLANGGRGQGRCGDLHAGQCALSGPRRLCQTIAHHEYGAGTQLEQIGFATAGNDPQLNSILKLVGITQYHLWRNE